MAIQNLAKLYEGNNLSGATDGVIYLPVLFDVNLQSVEVLTDEAQTGDAVFEVLKNGVVITGLEALTIGNGQKLGKISELDVDLVEGDEILLNLLSGSISAPITLNLEGDDGVSGGATSIDELDDVFLDDPQEGQVMKFIGGVWTNAADEEGTGGGSGGGVSDDPDIPPSSADSRDDEFTGTSLNAKWTNLNSSTVAVGNGAVKVEVPLNYNSANWKGIKQTVSGTFTMTAKIEFQSLNEGYQWAGLFIQQANNAAGIFFGFYYSSGEGLSLKANKITNNTTWDEVDIVSRLIGGIPHLFQSGYFQLQVTSTLVKFRYSVNGRQFYEIASITRSTYMSAPTLAGLLTSCYYNTTGKVVLICDWIRFTA